MRLGFLASGKLGYEVLNRFVHDYKPVFIATDSSSQNIVKLAGDSDIPLFKGNPRKGNLLAFLEAHAIQADLVLSINYLFLIESDLIRRFPHIVNFHGSLLPKYRGRTPHVWAIINGEMKTGVTAHLIDEGCDTGDIVLQNEVPVQAEDTGADILQKFENLYPDMVSGVIEKFSTQNVELRKQDNSKATFFGKRTPADGLIDWNWQKDRIRNWVRAQAAPYPGAFSWYQEKKIVIDKVDDSDLGFNQDDPNGLILETSPVPVIKCPNGAIKLMSIREGISLKKNDVLK